LRDAIPGTPDAWAVDVEEAVDMDKHAARRTRGKTTAGQKCEILKVRFMRSVGSFMMEIILYFSETYSQMKRA